MYTHQRSPFDAPHFSRVIINTAVKYAERWLYLDVGYFGRSLVGRGSGERGLSERDLTERGLVGYALFIE